MDKKLIAAMALALAALASPAARAQDASAAAAAPEVAMEPAAGADAMGMAMGMPATVDGSLMEVSYFLGVRLGEGMLNAGGQEQKFTVRGLSVLSVGLAGGPFKGKVSNLSNLADFEGTYTGAEVGAAVGLGGNVQRWVNKKGVVIELQNVEVGAELRMGPGALSVRFAK